MRKSIVLGLVLIWIGLKKPHWKPQILSYNTKTVIPLHLSELAGPTNWIKKLKFLAFIPLNSSKKLGMFRKLKLKNQQFRYILLALVLSVDNLNFRSKIMGLMIFVTIENSITPLPDYFVQAGFRAGGNNRVFDLFVVPLPLKGAEKIGKQGGLNVRSILNYSH